MAEDDLHQPHDKLFKAGFQSPASTAAFLADHLPPTLADHIAWTELRLEPGTFIDGAFRHSESDLLFSTTLAGRNCRIYLLFEHQRQRDPWIVLRLLRYQIGIWERFRAANPKEERLPLILPVVLAQNAAHWELEPRFSALLDVPEGLAEDWAGWVPEFLCRFIQLADLPYDRIQGTPEGVLVLRALKAEQVRELLGEDVWDEALMSQVQPGLMEAVLRYILAAASVDKEAFVTKVQTLGTLKLQNAAMTLAQQFRQEGRQEGHLQGRQEGQVLSKQQDILEVLEIRFGRVPEGLAEVISGITDLDRLRALHRSAIQCPDLEAFAIAL